MSSEEPQGVCNNQQDDKVTFQISSPDPIHAKNDQAPSPLKLDFDKDSSDNNIAENNSSTFDLDVSVDPTNLESLWYELGLLPSEIEKEKNKLNKLISEVRYRARKEASMEKIRINEEIRNIKFHHIELLRAIGASKTECDVVEQAGHEGTLRQRLAEVRSNFEIFKPKCTELITEFEELKKQTDELFDKIGYSKEDRGEFGEIGETDLSKERQQRFKDKIKALEEEVDARTKEFAILKEKILNLTSKLGVGVSPRINQLFESNEISTRSFQIVQEYIEDLSVIRNSRIAQISELALAISHEWDLLGVSEQEKKDFVEMHSQLTERCIQNFSDELLRLQKLRNEKLPELIERIKIEIVSICQTLHYTQQEIDDIISNAKEVPDDNMATFSEYESVLFNMKRKLVLSQPIIDLMKQRDELIKEYEEVEIEEKAFKDNRDDKTIDKRAEKIRRRYKFVLPRVEKKILIGVLEYKQTNGTDFLWDGKKVEDDYANISLSPAELSQLRTDAKRKSVSSQKSTNTDGNKANKNLAFPFE